MESGNPQAAYSGPDMRTIKRGPIVAALIIGAFVAILNETLLNIAFPALMRSFHITADTVQWLATSYMLVVGILVPITALLQQWYTTRQMFLSAMTLFLAGSVICAFSPAFGVLLVGRVVQALGAGLMMPVMMNTILLIFPPENRGGAMGMIGLVIMSAPAIGPTLSGLIVEHLGWPWLFYLVIPFAAFSILFAAAYLKNVSVPTKPKVDILSILLSCLGFGGVVYGFSNAAKGWSSPVVLWCLLAGGICVVLFVWRQFVVKDPILDLRSFRYSMFSLVTVQMVILMMSLFATMIMLPLFLQNVLALTALSSGLVLMPGSILNGLMAPVTGKLFDKLGPRALVIPGLALLVASVFLFSRINTGWTAWHVILVHVLLMIGLSLVMMPAQTTGLNQLPRSLYAHGTAILNTLQQVSGAIGTALFVSILSAGSRNYLAASRHPTDPAEGLRALVAGFHQSFLVGVYLAVAALVLGLFLKRVKAPKSEQDERGFQPVAVPDEG